MSKPALIVIDLQTAMLDGAQFAPMFDHEALLARVAALLAGARAAGTPVAFVQHDGGEGHPLARGAPGWPIHPAIAPLAGEPIFEKTVGGAFAETQLEAWLAEQGADEVVLTGAQTDQCVNATFGGAKARGLAIAVVADAHSTWPSGGKTAAEIIAEHNAAFANAGARLIDTQTLIADLAASHA
jgi:nicotinamidase-related amidase